jgi:hypothetical protein
MPRIIKDIFHGPNFAGFEWSRARMTGGLMKRFNLARFAFSVQNL